MTLYSTEKSKKEFEVTMKNDRKNILVWISLLRAIFVSALTLSFILKPEYNYIFLSLILILVATMAIDHCFE